LKRGKIQETIQQFGLTEKEIEVYIFLAKQGPLTCSMIAKQLKTNKGVVHRKLKSLQKKGLVESTLEYPTRFTAVSFEKIIDSFIQSKKEEVALIEEAKNDLLSEWKKISRTEPESPLDRFSIIEGYNKVFQRCIQLIEGARYQFLAAFSISDLIKAEQRGVFDTLNHIAKKSEVEFRVLTELSKKDLKTIKYLKNKLNSRIGFRGRNPKSGLPIFPRIMLRDNEEVIIFISEHDNTPQKNDLYFSTNCGTIVQAFFRLFQELWNNSSEIEKQVIEMEKGHFGPKARIYRDDGVSQKKYKDILNSASKEILIITSSLENNYLISNLEIIRNVAKKGVRIKILTPIDFRNLKSITKFSSFCDIKHIPKVNRETTLIDGQHLFQLLFPQVVTRPKVPMNLSNMLLYTDAIDKVQQTKSLFFNIWKSAQPLSSDFLDAKLANTHLSLSQPHQYSSSKKQFHELSKQITIEIEGKVGKNLDCLEYETIVGPYTFSEPISGDEILILKGSTEVVIMASIKIGEREYLLGKDFDYFEKLTLKYDTNKNDFNFIVKTEYDFKNLMENSKLMFEILGKRFEEKEKIFHEASFEISGTNLFKEASGKGISFSERIEDLGEFRIYAKGIGQIENIPSIISDMNKP